MDRPAAAFLVQKIPDLACCTLQLPRLDKPAAVKAGQVLSSSPSAAANAGLAGPCLVRVVFALSQS